MLGALLKDKIIIEKGTPGTSSQLSPLLNYSEYVEVYAGVYVRSGVTQYNESEELLYTTEFTIRYNKVTKEINNKYRIKYNDDYYRIIEVIETERKHTIKIITQRFYGE